MAQVLRHSRDEVTVDVSSGNYELTLSAGRRTFSRNMGLWSLCPYRNVCQLKIRFVAHRTLKQHLLKQTISDGYSGILQPSCRQLISLAGCQHSSDAFTVSGYRMHTFSAKVALRSHPVSYMSKR